MLLLAAVAIAAVAFVRPVSAAPSPQLASALSTLRSLNDSQFEKVVYWSRNGASRPFYGGDAVNRAENQILDLPQPGRDATLAWLRGQGRDALYQRGATDSDIGGRRPAIMSPSGPTPRPTPQPTATPNPYRIIPLASETLGSGGQTMRKIQILGGFAAVRRDGRAAIICVSFKNNATETASRILFEFPLYGPQGGELGALTLDRRGEFSPGVDINGWPDLQSWQSGIGHRGFGDNCTYVEQGIPSNPLLRAQSAGYRVLEVNY